MNGFDTLTIPTGIHFDALEETRNGKVNHLGNHVI